MSAAFREIVHGASHLPCEQPDQLNPGVLRAKTILTPETPSIRHEPTIAAAIEKVNAGDPGAVFEDNVIGALRALQQADRAGFVRVRAEIKKLKDVSIVELDRALRSGGEAEDRAVADRLIDLASERCVFFHDADMAAYATFENGGHGECWPIGSNGFTEWLAHEFYKAERSAPSEMATRTALATLTGQAKFEGEEHDVAVRVARRGDTYYVDLCDDAWQAVEITPGGWRVVADPPVRFVRWSSMRPLPVPVAGGSIDPLWRAANIPEGSRLMVLAWLIECLRPDTPYAILEVVGEQGSAKSTTQSVLRDLVDPNLSNCRAAPKNTEDIFVSARNSHMASFENLSHLAPAYQDALCVLATGGGFATRTLYSNADETVLNLKKPVILNGIAVVVTAQDLLDRAVHVDLPEITSRLTASEIATQFERDRPGILGGLFDLFVAAINMLPAVKIDPKVLPRMADFAMLGEAVYRIHGKPPGAFLTDYGAMRQEGVHRTLEASPVAVAALAYLDNNPSGWDGTVKGLFEALTKYKPDGEGWPRSPKGFADALRRIAPSLRLIGINARIADKPGMRGYLVVLKRKPATSHIPAKASSSEQVHNVHEVHAPAPTHELHEHDERGSGVLAPENNIGPTDAEVF